jgi:hypothetical protein
MNSTKSLGAISRALLVALVVLLAAGLVMGMQYWMKPPTQPETEVGQKAAEEFLGLVRTGKAGEAWDASTAEFKSIEGRESFSRTAAKAALLKEPLNFTSTQTVTVQDQPRTEFLFQGEKGGTVRVLVGYEGGLWKVDRLTL